jgi:hypothetical protein
MMLNSDEIFLEGDSVCLGNIPCGLDTNGMEILLGFYEKPQDTPYENQNRTMIR